MSGQIHTDLGKGLTSTEILSKYMKKGHTFAHVHSNLEKVNPKPKVNLKKRKNVEFGIFFLLTLLTFMLVVMTAIIEILHAII